MGNNNSSRDPFILTRKRRNYTQSGATPKISIDQGTYQKLQYAAVESGRSISEIARMAIGYAMGRLEWAEE